MTDALRALADPVSADELRRYAASGWEAVLDETWVPRFSDDPTSEAFTAWETAAYECGMVPHDVQMSDLAPWWHGVNKTPDRLQRMGLSAIRKWNHVMWRGHRWCEGGFVDLALRLGAIQAMLRRVDTIVATGEPTDGVKPPVAIPRADTYGGVLMPPKCDPNGGASVLLREPKGHFGGYAWTFPKGRPGKGESPEQAALRSVREDTGYEAHIVGALADVFDGDTSTAGYFLMEPIGEQGAFTRQTLQTRWATFEEARKLITQSSTRKGRGRDLAVLDVAEDNHIDRMPARRSE